MGKQNGKQKAAEQQQVVEQEQVAAATLVEQEAKPAEGLKGASRCKFPVARTWITCHNAIAAATAAGQPAPSRKALTTLVLEQGVSLMTARTQIQAYLKATNSGRVIPTKLPKGVEFASVAASE